MAYADLEILIQRWSDGGHAVDMRFRTADGQADSDLAVNVPIKLDFETLLRHSGESERYGRALTGMVFADPQLRGALLRVRGFVEGAEMPLRIRLRLDPSADELHGVRWETLCDPDRDTPIARSERVILSRYLDSANLSRIQLPTRDELQALVVVASPHNLGRFNLQPFDAAAESERVRRALGDIPAATMVSGDGGPTVGLQAICDALRFGYSILYIVCHGTLRDGQPMLCLEDERGDAAWVSGDELADRIADLGAALRPLMVVLASCQSVGTSHGSAVPAALGPRLAAAGVGAVVGMQGDIPMSTVARLMPRFFGELAESGEIDRALAVGRAGLAASDPWWMPVLFLRVRDGRLWREAAAPQPAAAAPVTRPPARPASLLWAAGASALLVILVVAAGGMLAGGGGSGAAAATAQSERSTAIAEATRAAQMFVNAGSGPDEMAQAAASSATSAPPTATPVPTVAPVAAGKYMILVADLEPAAQASRDYARDIADDLRLNIEQLPFSDVEVRRYREVVTSDGQARAAAEAAGAAVIIWGRYDESRIDLQVQAGDLDQFMHIPAALDAATIARTANLRLQLPTTGEIRSTALAALAALQVLRTADGDSFAILRQSKVQDELLSSLQVAEVQGQSSAVWGYRYILYFYSEPEKSLDAANRGLANDPGNPILHMYRAVIYLRLERPDDAAEDVRVASRVVPGWAIGEAAAAAVNFQQGDLAGSVAAFDRALEIQPEDWFAYSYRGGLKYLLGDMAGARADVERAIEIGPRTSSPYATATMIALREGRLADARELMLQARQRFSGTIGFDSAFYTSLLGGTNPVSQATSNFDLMLAGQYGDVIATADQGLALAQAIPVPPLVASDLYFVRGFAQCNRGDDMGANESYSQALSYSPEFTLLHLLRAEARGRLGDLQGAQEDLGVAAQSEQTGPLVELIQSGQLTLTCKSLLS